MLARRAYSAMLAWKQNPHTRALLVMGARQVGKTTLVREFAHNNYERFAEINFFDRNDAAETINAARSADDLFMRISALARAEIVPGKTLIFLDEVQECLDPSGSIQSLTWLKFLVERTDIDYVLSGSLLGLDAFDTRSLPVGFMQTLTMFPLDFEEFCWAEGITQPLLDAAWQMIDDHAPVPDYLHRELLDTYRRYMLVGGMPDAVQSFEESKDLMRTREIQQGIVELYRADIAKYVTDRIEKRQIRMVFDAIPGQLNKQNKRFKYTRLGKNLRFANLETAFDWLEHAGVALPATKVGEPAFPLGLSAESNMLKLYLCDVGLLTAQLMGDVDIKILNGKTGINFGSIFENIAAQEIRATGGDLHYYYTPKVGEIDFVLQNARGEIALFEIKSGKEYRRHSALDNLLSTPNYSIEHAYVCSGGNVEQAGRVCYVPVYAVGHVARRILGRR